MFFSAFSPSEHTFFPCFQLKSWLFWTEQERLIFPPTAPQHILSLCCTGQSRPAVTKLSFLCFFPFLLLCGSCSACPLLWISTLWSCLIAAFLFYLFHPVFTSLWSYRAFCRPFCLQLSAFSPCEPLKREDRVGPVDTSFSSRPVSQSDVPSQACWANERWRDINLIAVRDRYIDRGGCNKPRRDCWLPVRLAFRCKSRLIHRY